MCSEGMIRRRCGSRWCGTLKMRCRRRRIKDRRASIMGVHQAGAVFLFFLNLFYLTSCTGIFVKSFFMRIKRVRWHSRSKKLSLHLVYFSSSLRCIRVSSASLLFVFDLQFLSPTSRQSLRLERVFREEMWLNQEEDPLMLGIGFLIYRDEPQPPPATRFITGIV